MNKDYLDFVLNEQIQINLITFIEVLMLAGILSFIIQITYLKFSTSLSNKFDFSKNFVILGLATALVITIVKSSLALSLVLVGALSIVRFRHPVRSHFELTMFFALITLGIAAGVNMKFAILLLTIIILTIFGIEIIQKVAEKFGLNLYQLSFSEGISNYIVELSSSEKIDDIDNNNNLINSFFSKSDSQWEYKLVFKNKNEMDVFVKKISTNNKVISYKTSSAIS